MNDVNDVNDDTITAVTGAIAGAIAAYRREGGVNENGFSVRVTYDADDGEYSADAEFRDTHRMTIMYSEGTDDDAVQRLWNGDIEAIQDIADIMIRHEWIDGACPKPGNRESGAYDFDPPKTLP